MKSDLSSLTFHTLSTEISDLSSDTSTEFSVLRAEKGSELEDLSSLTFHTLSTEISDLSSDTSREISDLSSLTFHTLSTEISDLSSDTSREISDFTVAFDILQYASIWVLGAIGSSYTFTGPGNLSNAIIYHFWKRRKL